MEFGGVKYIMPKTDKSHELYVYIVAIHYRDLIQFYFANTTRNPSILFVLLKSKTTATANRDVNRIA